MLIFSHRTVSDSMKLITDGCQVFLNQSTAKKCFREFNLNSQGTWWYQLDLNWLIFFVSIYGHEKQRKLTLKLSWSLSGYLCGKHNLCCRSTNRTGQSQSLSQFNPKNSPYCLPFCDYFVILFVSKFPTGMKKYK